jgi:hypothetical protein
MERSLGESKRNRVAQAEDGKEIDNELHLPSKRKDHSKIRLDHLPSAYHHNSLTKYPNRAHAELYAFERTSPLFFHE